MPTGYLVSFGTILNGGDPISGGAVDFNDATVIGTGTWTWSGTRGGTTFTNATESGTYILGTDGGLYFVPTNGPVDTLSTASAGSTPTFNANFGSSANNSINFGGGTQYIYGGSSASPLVNTGNDTINAGSGNDVAFGGDGNDTINGGTGNDTISGGTGNDSLLGGDGDDVVLLADGFGTDTILGGEAAESTGDVIDARDVTTGIAFTYSSNDDGTLTSGTNSASVQDVERYILGSGNDTVNASAVTGGVNVDLGAGNDSIILGTGQDSVQGGDGIDTVSYQNAASGVEVNLGLGFGSAGAASDDVLFGFENVTGSASADTLVGTTGENVIVGAGGNDSIVARGGADTIDAGAGNDTVFAGEGDDSVLGGAGADSLFGGGGADFIDGGGGDDVIYGGGPAEIEGVGGSNTVSSAFGGFFLGNFGDIDTNEGNGTSENPGALLGTYGGAGTPLYGDLVSIYAPDPNNSGNIEDNDNGQTPEAFFIDGQTYFIDTVNTYGGTVTFTDGSTGSFTAIIIQTTSGDVFLLPPLGSAAEAALLGSAPIQSVTLNNVTSATTSWVMGAPRYDIDFKVPASDIPIDGGGSAAAGDTLLGGAGNDFIDGQDGDDVLSGGTGNDTLVGGVGNDLLEGDAGSDSISGGEGDDTLDGGDGADVLDGGAGSDAITVGLGDTASGGDDADAFTLDSAQLGTGTAFTIDGGAGAGTSQDFDTIDLGGLTKVGGSYSGALDGDGNSRSGSIQVTDGVNTYTVNFTEIEGTICFARGTHIETDRGLIRVENLRRGDLVRTRDNGLKPLAWIGAQRLTAELLERKPHLRPIRIRAGALGQGLPVADLVVSPQHRVLVRSKVAERIFGQREALAAAKQLLLIDGIDHDEAPDGTEYWHFLFDRHEIVFAEGAETESLFTGPEALKAVHPEARAELLELFPGIARATTPARVIASGREARRLAYRHSKNGKPLLELA